MKDVYTIQIERKGELLLRIEITELSRIKLAESILELILEDVKKDAKPMVEEND